VEDQLKITCPCCNTILIVDRKGKILEERKPILEESTGDRFEDAFQKVKGSKDAAEAKFKEAQRKEQERMSRLESMFNEGMKRVTESGEPVEKPQREMDMD